ncbi:tetratricopeptide repeat protein [Tumidithrix elongata]
MVKLLVMQIPKKILNRRETAFKPLSSQERGWGEVKSWNTFAFRSLIYCLILSGFTLEFSGIFSPQFAYAQTCDIGSATVHPGNYKLRGSVFLKKESFQEALDCFEIALQDPRGREDPELWNNHGLALAGLKRFEEALASYDQAVRIKPGARFVDRVQPLVQPKDYYLWWFNRATALVDLNRNDEALASLDKSLQIKSDYGFVWFFRGLTLFRLKRYDEARFAYRRSVLLSPNTPYVIKSLHLLNLQDYVVYYGEAEAKSRLGRYKEAIKAFERGKQVRLNNPQIEFFENNVSENLYENYIDGIRSLDRSEYNKALTQFDLVIATKPNYASAWDGKADALMALKRYPEAIAAYDRVTVIEPYDYPAWYKKGNALMKAKRNGEALQAYQKAIDISGGFAEVWHNRGVIFYNQNKNKEAIDAYSRSLKANTLWGGISRADTQYALAATLYRAGRYRESLSAVEQVLKAQPDYKEAVELRKLIKRILG